MTWRWPLADDQLTSEDRDELAAWIKDATHLTQGELVSEFEKEWSRYTGIEHSIFVNSGSSANFAALMAVSQMRPGRLRIAAPAVTWSTTVSPVLILGHALVLVDVARETLGIDIDAACQAIRSGSVDGVFVTHLLGLNAGIDRLVSEAETHGVFIIEDCCEATGTMNGSSHVGAGGLLSTFSFYFSHHLSTIEGGMVCTNDADLADSVRMIRSHGLARASANHQTHTLRHPQVESEFLFPTLGLNMKSTEINAFIGLMQLRRLGAWNEHRNRIANLFFDALPPWLWRDYERAGMSSFSLPLIPAEGAGRDAMLAGVASVGAESRPVVAGNLQRQPFITSSPDVSQLGSLRVADQVDAGVYIGNGPHVTEAMVGDLIAELENAAP